MVRRKGVRKPVAKTQRKQQKPLVVEEVPSNDNQTGHPPQDLMDDMETTRGDVSDTTVDYEGGIQSSASSEESSGSSCDSDEYFPVEKIVDRRKIGDQLQYLVKWKNSTDNQNTWEDPENFPLSMYSMILEFDEKFERENERKEKIMQKRSRRTRGRGRPPATRQTLDTSDSESDIEEDYERVVASTSKRLRRGGSSVPKRKTQKKEEFSAARRALEEGLFTDLTIVAKNGAEIKCHKIYLQAFSIVLDEMIEENECDHVDMSQMSEEAVWALLRYLYCQDLKGPSENEEIAFQLMKAARTYKLFQLEESMTTLLEDNGRELSVKLALSIYIFVRNDVLQVGLKEKALLILNSNVEELEDLNEYCDIFESDPDLAMELSKDMVLAAMKRE